MKQISKIISLITVVCVLCTAFAAVVSASAPELTIADYNADTNLITVTGTSTGNTIIKVLSSDVDASAVSNPALYMDFHQFYANGDFSYDFAMPKGGEAGKYTVYLVNADGNDSINYRYFSISEANSLIPELNAKTSADALYDFVSENAEKLGFDTDDVLYSTSAEGACDILFEAFADFADSVEFNSAFKFALAVSSMNGASSDDINATLQNYSDILGIDYDADYANNARLSDSVKSDMLKLLAKTDFPSELKRTKDGGNVSFKALLSDISALSAIRCAGGWKEIKVIFEDTFSDELSDIKDNTSGFTKDRATAVYTKLTDMNFDKFTDISDNLEDAVDAVKRDENKDNSSSGTSRPGGGGGSYTVPDTMTNPSDRYDATDSGDIAPGGGEVQGVSQARPVLTEDAGKLFADVSSDFWGNSAISALSGSNIISGYEDGSFRPDNTITRAEFTKILVEAFSIKAPPAEFNDVSDEAWYKSYVSNAAGAGIITGYEGNFNPEANITRQDAAVIMYRVAALFDITYTKSAEFDDMLDVSLYAMTAVRGLGGAGVIKGFEGRFNPFNNLTRAEAAQLIYGFINTME